MSILFKCCQTPDLGYDFEIKWTDSKERKNEKGKRERERENCLSSASRPSLLCLSLFVLSIE